MKLTRDTYCETGIFGKLDMSWGSLIGVHGSILTLEHAYPVNANDGTSVETTYAPKIPAGTYTCRRGTFTLAGGVPTEYFEVTNVPGHTDILIHPGNFENDSSGCILIGTMRQGNTEILNSRFAFQEFMDNLNGINEFTLEVS